MEWPATVRVVERDVAEVRGETLNSTVPLPLPVDPETMVTQLALSLAVHAAVRRVFDVDPFPTALALRGKVRRVHRERA